MNIPHILVLCAWALTLAAYLILYRRHRRLVTATQKLLFAWPMDGQAANIPPYIVRDVCLALLDEPEARRTAQDVLVDIEDKT